MVKTLGGLVAGILVAVVSMIAIEALGNSLFGLSADASPSATAPIAALLFPLGGWFIATLVGAYVAIRISKVAWTGWVIAACIVAAAAMNFALLRYPLWLMAAGVIVPPLAAWLARPLARVHQVPSE